LNNSFLATLNRWRSTQPSDEIDRRNPLASQEAALELIWLHARMLQRMPVIQFFLVIGFWLLVSPAVPTAQFLGWAALTLTVECVRAWYGNRALQHKTFHEARYDNFWFVVLVAAAGGAIGVAGVLFLPQVNIGQRAALGALLTGIPAAGVAVSQSSRFIIGTYSLAILAPSCYAWVLIYPEQAAAMTLFPLLYSGVLVLVAADNEKLVLRSILIRHERDRVVKDLEQRNADVRDAMAKAEQSAQARARVLAAASHDLRQPLHALSVYSAILAANPTPETLREVGRDIDQIVRSLGSLLGGLLDLSRLSTGYYVPDKKVFSLDEIVNSVCGELQPMASAKQLVLRRALPQVLVRSDPIAVGRILRNLLDNAIKYTDSGEVSVEINVEGDAAILSVADNGRGIPEAEHVRIFEEFYQLDNPGRDRSRGVGLGLAIVQRLCELLDAKISLVSSPGKGARFSVAFPGAVAAREPIDQGETKSSSLGIAGKRVYMVDDEIDIRKSMSALLAIWEMEVESAGSPAAASQLFQQHGKPDLLIADLRLGSGEHGAAMSDRLRRDFGYFPVLIITGETASDALREANQAGYVVLQKPIAPEVLRDAIGSAIAADPN
jgi:two-component system, sensor histidine kinase